MLRHPARVCSKASMAAPGRTLRTLVHTIYLSVYGPFGPTTGAAAASHAMA